MAFCRGRLLFDKSMDGEEENGDLNIQVKLNFDSAVSDMMDSDGEDGDIDSGGAALMSPFHRGDTTPETDSSFLWDSGLCSPTPKACHLRRSPRRLGKSPVPFGLNISSPSKNMADSSDEAEPNPNSFTPPHKKLRSLRLYDTPHTPKSLLQKAQRRINISRMSQTPMTVTRETSNLTTNQPRSLPTCLEPRANVNPFTPSAENNNHQTGVKRARNDMDSGFDDSLEEDTETELPCTKKLALHDINTSRYHEEFLETDKLGDGEFGAVYKCIHRLDGCTYAIKKSKTPVAGSVYERTAMNEVYAHAVLGKHPHVVSYFSAWAENDHMYIQNEYCNGGSLADVLTADGPQEESQLINVLLHCARGLRYIHSQKLVHLDIKPGNIFLHVDPKQSSESGLEEDIDENSSDSTTSTDDVTYKIGDLGHVTSLHATRVEEGDCRYLPSELLQDNYAHLPKADIFSLALTIWEAGSGKELPKNGDLWHIIRRGELPPLDNCSAELNHLLLTMVQPDPRARPTAAMLCQHPTLCPFARKTRQQLRQELNQERFKNELLTRQLKAATAQNKPVTQVLPAQVGTNRSSRIIGKKVNRSMSLTCF